jgi:hypothetical protein
MQRQKAFMFSQLHMRTDISGLFIFLGFYFKYFFTPSSNWSFSATGVS